MSNKGAFSAVVVSRKGLGHPFHRLKLEFVDAGARAFSDFRPCKRCKLRNVKICEIVCSYRFEYLL